VLPRAFTANSSVATRLSSDQAAHNAAASHTSMSATATPYSYWSLSMPTGATRMLARPACLLPLGPPVEQSLGKPAQPGGVSAEVGDLAVLGDDTEEQPDRLVGASELVEGQRLEDPD
jgi:hypothetical protein